MRANTISSTASRRPEIAVKIEKRRHSRTAADTRLTVSHESFGAVQVDTRDISDAGVFALHGGAFRGPPPGTVLRVQVLGLMGEAARAVAAEVVRCDGEGFALRFLESPF